MTARMKRHTEKKNLSASSWRNGYSMSRSRAWTSRRDKFTPFIFLRGISEYIVVEVLHLKLMVWIKRSELRKTHRAPILTKEFSSNTPQMTSIWTSRKSSIRSSTRRSFHKFLGHSMGLFPFFSHLPLIISKMCFQK